MASLAAQDSYLQGLARKVCVQHNPESRKRKFVPKPGQPEDAGRQLKKKKRKKPRKEAEKTNAPSVKQAGANANKPAPGQKVAPQASKSAPQGVTQSKNESLVTGNKSELGSFSFSAMNLLRQRLHEKIKKASGQDDTKELPPAVLEKRQRRKYERERKKRRRKELKMKAKMEKKEAEEAPVEPESKKEKSVAELVFNRVEVHEENELSKIQKKKEKRKSVKGNITPLTGRNYKQLLSRLDTRKKKLEELKNKDQKKAQELENKMKWTNALYKVEGVKIRDNEERLKEALKRKEKRKAQRQRQWEKRTEKVVEKMQQRQEKRRKNIQKKKKDRIEKKKARARKKGRVLPEDLKKAGLMETCRLLLSPSMSCLVLDVSPNPDALFAMGRTNSPWIHLLPVNCNSPGNRPGSSLCWGFMWPVGTARLVPSRAIYKPIFDDEVQLVRSLAEVRKTRFSVKRERLALVRDSEISTDAKLLPCYQQKCVERTPYNDSPEKPLLYREATTFQKAWKGVDVKAAEEVRALPNFVVPEETRSNILECLSERRRGRHDEALTSMYHELACIAGELEPLVLEPGKFLLAKLMESDRKIELLFKKIEVDTTLGGFSIEGLEELWNVIHQESLTGKKWVREMDEALKKVEWSRANKITDVLRKYTVILEEIAFVLPADVYRLINNEAMMINRALLANQRAIAKLFFNLMKSEMKRELSYRLKWQDRVKDWKLIQKNYVVHSFREFMANEEIQNPPTVKTEMENMIKDQILLNERRLEFLQHLGDLLPPIHTKADIVEWYRNLVNLNRSIDTHNVECMVKIHTQYEMVQQKCLAEMQLCKNNLLNLNVCTKKEAEEIVNSELFPLTEKLQSQFEEKLERMNRDFEELAKQNKQNCRDLYSYFQEAMGLWDVHQLKLSQQEGEFQKKLDECRWKRDNLIQMMEANLDAILAEMRTASSEKKLKIYLENTFSSLDDIRAKYESFNPILMDKVMAYPEAILRELISYSISVSQYFNVKEIFKQNLQGEIDSMFQDQELVKASGAEGLVEQQAESIVQENEGKQEMDSCQRENEETNTAENEAIIAQETEETEEEEDGENIPHESEEPEHAGQEVSFTQVMFNSSKAESSEIPVETFSTSSGNTYTVLKVGEAGKTDIPETHFTKYEKKESLPMYLKYGLIDETVFIELKERIRLSFFEHLEKWFAESLSNSCAIVAAKKEELNSELQLRLHLHQQMRENIKTNIYNVRAVELLLHKERLESHCAGVEEALKNKRAEFLKFCDEQNIMSKNLHSRICDMESVLLSAPTAEKLVSFSNSLHSELRNNLEMIKVSLRSYWNYLEEALGKLKNSNVQFLKACRLFLEGGNFSPEEAKSFTRRLEAESERINSFESLIKTDMEKMESSCMEQATGFINQSEKKFHHLFTNRVFMEKIQRLLSNLRVQIKSEVANSTSQAVALNSSLKKLRQKIDACAADKEALTSEELYDFAKGVLKKLKERSQYLDCLLVKAMSPRDNKHFTPLATDVTLQGPIAAAIRTERLRDESKVMVMGLDPVRFPLLNPSRMGKSALDDLSISVIKNLLGIQSSRKSSGLNKERNDQSRSPGPGPQSSATYNSASRITKKLPPKKKMSRGRVQKSTKPVLGDKRFQVFGEKPPEADTFKGIIMNILWTGNNSLLSLAEEFYQKEKLQITMSEDVPETFERCAKMLKQHLLSYQSQTDDYHNSCLMEFQDQLKLFEKELPHVYQLAIDSLLKEHEQKLSYSTGQIRQLFNKQLEDWEKVKAVHKNQLHPSLGHPDNLVQLDALCQEEIKRQKDQTDGIHLNTQMLQDCAAECAQNFFSALAAFTEKLLLELDESITVDDVQVAKTEIPKEKTSTLIHHKQTGLPLEVCEVNQLIERGSRTWPGIPRTTLTYNSDHILCRETASVTTAKTTLGHVAAVEARDAVYKKYKCKLEQQFAQIKEESTAQLRTIQCWQDWWKRSIQKIKQLYT